MAYIKMVLDAIYIMVMISGVMIFAGTVILILRAIFK